LSTVFNVNQLSEETSFFKNALLKNIDFML
jgi:hypothetical protein